MSVIGIAPSPVRLRVAALSTSNLTLSGAQTVDSVALVAGDLCGCVGQSDNKNAVYLVQSGAWLPVDPGFGTGLEIYAKAGGSNANKVYGCDTTGAITWGTTSTTFTLKSSSGAAFNPASPGAIGETTPAAATFTTLKSTNQQVGFGSPTATASYLDETAFKLQGASTLNSLRLTNETGSKFIVGNGSTSTTSVTIIDAMSISLANNATYDYPLNGNLGGYVTIAAPANTSGTIGGTVYFGADASTTLGGLTPTNLTATLSTANKINVGASGGNVRIENKTGGTLVILAVFHIVGSA